MKINVTYTPQLEVVGVRRMDGWALLLAAIRRAEEDEDNDRYPEAYDGD